MAKNLDFTARIARSMDRENLSSSIRAEGFHGASSPSRPLGVQGDKEAEEPAGLSVDKRGPRDGGRHIAAACLGPESASWAAKTRLEQTRITSASRASVRRSRCWSRL